MTTPKEPEKSAACDDDGIVSVVYNFAKKVVIKYFQFSCPFFV